MKKLATFLGIFAAAVFLTAGAAYSQVPGGPPMVSIVNVNPASGYGHEPLQAVVTYSLTKASTVEFFVDGTEVGSVSAPAGQSAWTTPALLAGTYTLEVSCPGNAQYVNYVVAPTYLDIITFAGTGGTVVSNSPVEFYGTGSVDIFAFPGYHIQDVYIDGLDMGPVSSWTFPYMVEDHTVTADFAPNSN